MLPCLLLHLSPEPVLSVFIELTFRAEAWGPPLPLPPPALSREGEGARETGPEREGEKEKASGGADKYWGPFVTQE